MSMLADRALSNLKPDNGPLSDSQVHGLMIRPNGNGGKWALRYVSSATRKRREMGLGVYPTTRCATPECAHGLTFDEQPDRQRPRPNPGA